MTSICWNCKNGRADRCDWIDKKEKVWEKAREEIRGRNWGPFKVWTVQECKRYDPENPHWRQPQKPGRQKKKAAGRPYTPKDDALLLELREQGVPCGVIAERMGRTVGSIYRRIAYLKEMEVEREDDKVYATIGK